MLEGCGKQAPAAGVESSGYAQTLVRAVAFAREEADTIADGRLGAGLVLEHSIAVLTLGSERAWDAGI